MFLSMSGDETEELIFGSLLSWKWHLYLIRWPINLNQKSGNLNGIRRKKYVLYIQASFIVQENLLGQNKFTYLNFKILTVQCCPWKILRVSVCCIQSGKFILIRVQFCMKQNTLYCSDASWVTLRLQVFVIKFILHNLNSQLAIFYVISLISFIAVFFFQSTNITADFFADKDKLRSYNRLNLVLCVFINSWHFQRDISSKELYSIVGIRYIENHDDNL